MSKASGLPHVSNPPQCSLSSVMPQKRAPTAQISGVLQMEETLWVKVGAGAGSPRPSLLPYLHALLQQERWTAPDPSFALRNSPVLLI